MACIYSDNEGRCSICEEGDALSEELENGYCIFEDDPDPAESCESYESDNTCYDCGVDLNIAECECEE